MMENEVLRVLGKPSDVAGKSVAQALGSDMVATLLAVAHLQQSGRCATADAVAQYAGMAPGTAGGKLRRLSHDRGPLQQISRPCFRHPQSHHFVIAPWAAASRATRT